jgi:hypothetical protein
VSSAGTVTASFAPFPITPPRNLSLTPENAGIAAVWQPPDLDGGSPIASYTATAYLQSDLKAQHPIAHCTVPPDPNPSASLFCGISGLVNGMTYWVIVQATNTAGASSRSTSSPLVTPSATAGGAKPGQRSRK